MCGYYLPPCTFFFFNDTATTEIYTLSLHDALPICARGLAGFLPEPVELVLLHGAGDGTTRPLPELGRERDRLRALPAVRSEEHTSELQSPCNLVCRLLLEKKKELSL